MLLPISAEIANAVIANIVFALNVVLAVPVAVAICVMIMIMLIVVLILNCWERYICQRLSRQLCMDMKLVILIVVVVIAVVNIMIIVVMMQR